MLSRHKADRDALACDEVARLTLGQAVVLFSSDWELDFAQMEDPGVEFKAAW